MRGPLPSVSIRNHVLPGLAGLGVAGVLAASMSPLVAVVAGGVTAVVSRVGPVVGILAVHIVGILTLSDPPAVVLIGLEAACAPLLAMPINDTVSTRAAVGAWLAAAGIGGVVVLASVTTRSPLLVAIALFGTAAVVLYLLHRVELVTLGIVPEQSAGDAS